MEEDEEYKGEIKNCSYCGVDFKEGSIIIVGTEMGEGKPGKEVAFCGGSCQIGYTFKQKVPVCSRTQKYIGTQL